MNNEYYIKEYSDSRGLSQRTQQAMKTYLNHYSEFQQLSLHELLEEADLEEEQGLRWKRRKLKQRLITYTNHCKENMLLSSAKSYVKAVKSFYTHNEIEIGKLPRWNEKNAKIPEPITPNDLPTKELIRKAVDLADPLMKALILFLCSSGMSKVDVRSLTIKDFIEGTFTYHKQDNIYDALRVMMDSDEDIIPTFKMRRSKTNKYFITFCSPEATTELIHYLIIRDKRNKKYKRPLFSDDDYLFKVGEDYYHSKFVEINDALKLPKKGTFNQFRGHMLRKFHATQLEKHGMSRYLVRTLQGKSNGSVDDVYFYVDEDTLKKEYVNALDGVLIFTDVKEITSYSEEYRLLQQKYAEKEVEVKKIGDRLDSIEEFIASIDKPRGFDEVLDDISKT